MGEDLRHLPQVLSHSRRARRIMVQNIGLSLAIIAILIPLAALGVLGLATVVFIHELAEVLVILNAIRAARTQPLPDVTAPKPTVTSHVAAAAPIEPSPVACCGSTPASAAPIGTPLTVTTQAADSTAQGGCPCCSPAAGDDHEIPAADQPANSAGAASQGSAHP